MQDCIGYLGHAGSGPEGQGHRRGRGPSLLTPLFRGHSHSWPSLPRGCPMRLGVHQEGSHSSQTLEVSGVRETELG